VIRSIDGVAMVDSTDVTSRIGNAAPGTKLAIEVWRDGKPTTLTATVGALDDGKIAKNDADAGEPKGKLGVAVRPLSPEEQKQAGKAGLVVEKSGAADLCAGEDLVIDCWSEHLGDRQPTAGCDPRAAGETSRPLLVRSA
jgi:serine protease Do